MDITLQDVAVVVGSVLIFTAFMCYKDQIVAFLRGRWQRRHTAGARRVAMSSRAEPAGSEAVRDGSRTGSADLVPPRQNQAEPEPVRAFEHVIAFLAEHKLSDEEAADLLAVAERESGYLLSANKIRDTVGGSDAAIKARVAARRPRPAPPPPAPRLERPENGWG
jgi:hypothetical protein